MGRFRGSGFGELISKNVPCFLLHRMAAGRRADLEFALGFLGQLTNRNACHAINDITAINRRSGVRRQMPGLARPTLKA